MPAIRIQNLSKSFDSPLNLTTTGTKTDSWQGLLCIMGFKSKVQINGNIENTFSISGLALQDVSVEIEEGSVVCLRGASGSGKSVLLKLLARVTLPSKGRIEIKGKVNSLLAIGDNLDFRLTAEENISHHLKSMHNRILDSHSYLTEIINFAELEGFERVPLRTYSTGMLMRLSVALALHGNATIFLIDDILRVGDIAFQQKCFDRLQELKKLGCTLIIVSNEDDLITQLQCRTLTLNNGRIVSDSDNENQNLTNEYMSTLPELEWQVAPHLPENEIIALRSIDVDVRKKQDEVCMYLSLKYQTKLGPLQCRSLIDVMQEKLVLFRSLNPQIAKIEAHKDLIYTLEIPINILNDGVYSVMCGIHAIHNNIIHVLKAFDSLTLKVHREREVINKNNPNLFIIPVSWETESLTG